MRSLIPPHGLASHTTVLSSDFLFIAYRVSRSSAHSSQRPSISMDPRCPVPDKSGHHGYSASVSLIESQTIKVSAVAQVVPGPRSRVLRANRHYPISRSRAGVCADGRVVQSVMAGLTPAVDGERFGLGWLASKRGRAGLTDNRPTFLARERSLYDAAEACL